MARIVYTTFDKQEKSISLPQQDDFTVRLILVTTFSEQARETLWLKLAQEMRFAQEIERLASHAVYALPQHYFACILQFREPKPGDKVASMAWKRETVLLHHTRREWLIVADDPTTFLVDKKVVALMKILRHGMEIQIGDLRCKFQDIEEQVVDEILLKALGVRRKCPFCQGVFAVGDNLIRCPSCGTAHHADCWQEYGERCSGPMGCRYGLPSMEKRDSL